MPPSRSTSIQPQPYWYPPPLPCSPLRRYSYAQPRTRPAPAPPRPAALAPTHISLLPGPTAAPDLPPLVTPPPAAAALGAHARFARVSGLMMGSILSVMPRQSACTVRCHKLGRVIVL